MEPISYGEKETKYTVESAAGTRTGCFSRACFFAAHVFRQRIRQGFNPLHRKRRSQVSGCMFPLAINLMKYNGKVHAMPGDYMTMVLFYNTEIFKDAGWILTNRRKPATSF